MLRNLVGVKPDVQTDDLKRFVSSAFHFTHAIGLLILCKLVQSIVDQSHLSPFTRTVQPILPEYDHTLRLYPVPNAVSNVHVILSRIF